MITFLSQSLEASSASSIDVISNATRKDLLLAVSSGSLCQKLADGVLKANVSSLTSPDQLDAIRAICKSSNRLAFASNLVPTVYQPSPVPTLRPTSVRRENIINVDSSLHLVTAHFLGYLFIILLLACLRCSPCLFGCGVLGKGKGSPHLYDVLVILNDEEEAIFENIRHEDITFFRR